jgi:hypothetical protein
MKILIAYSDDNIIKLIISNDYLNDIIKIYQTISNKDNLLVSAILELFDNIKKNNLKKLISYLFEKHYDFFYGEESRNIQVFQDLIAKYDQGLDTLHNKAEDNSNSNSRLYKEFRNEIEEQYFDDDEDEEDDQKDYWSKKKQTFKENYITATEKPETTLLNRKKYSDVKLEDIFKDEYKEEEEELFRQLGKDIKLILRQE